MTPTQPAKRHSFFGNSVYIFLIRFFPVLASLIVTIVFSRRLDADIYGDYQNFWIQYFVLSAVACMGTHVFLLTYSPAYLKRLLQQLPKRVYWLLAGWIVISAFVLGWLQQANIGFAIAAAILIVYCVGTIVEAFLMAGKRFQLLSMVNVVFSFAFLWMHWVFLDGIQSLASLFSQVLLLAALRLIVYIVAAFLFSKKIETETSDELIHWKTVRSLWLHMGLFDILQILFRWADKFFISLLLVASVSAIYFNGSNEIPFLPLILGAVGSAGLIQLATVSGDNKLNEVIQLQHISGRILSAIVFPLFFFLLFFSGELFGVVFKHKYDLSVPVFLVTVLAIPVRAYNFTTVLQHYHKGRIINIGAVLDISLACLLMYPLYLCFQLPGVALAFVITTYLQAAFYLYHSGRVLQVSWLQLLPLRNWVIKAIVFFSLFIVLHYVLVRFLSEQMVLTCGCIALATTGLAALLLELKSYRAQNG
ncbi:lipopolysaccharide biosynthesis protein [Taibaiella soli]|uniref:lipopolysaccharide biosynthesis protein n=1 Tax=Taibaiella soli TaxID=1649169 RepID=UPI000F4E33D4|nr:hypothetical protein [Taibaiella soli]